MYPILTRTDYGFLYSFTAVWGIAILLTLYFLKRNHPKLNLFPWTIAILIGAILGGRIQFLIQNGVYFSENSGEIWELYQGGFAYHGALWGSLIATAVYSLYKRTNWFAHLAIYTLWLPIWHTAGWVACWLEGCAYGRPAFIGWATAELPDSFGVLAVRYQTQLGGIILTMLIALLVWRWQKTDRSPSPSLFWITLAALQLVHTLISFWRGDDSFIWQGVRSDVWLSLATIALCLLMLLPSTKTTADTSA